MLWQTLSSVRDIGRLHDIASVLVRHGFGDLVRRVGLANALERAGHALHWRAAGEYAQLSPPARVRHAFEELGPSFVKLGQMLATRVDLLEPEWIAEFSKLQDHAPAVPYGKILEQLIEDLGAPPEVVFAEFDPEPIAAASIAQVYGARTHEGDDVILKVRRPGIRPIIEADLRLMARIAQVIESESPELRAFRPQQVVRRFARTLRNELDFVSECRNASRIAASFDGWRDEEADRAAAGATATAEIGPIIVIPRVYWTWCTERLCVQQRIDGIAGRQVGMLDPAGFDRRLLARRGARAILKMILEDGFFHADPHQGNVFYLPGDRIAFVDFGMVGRLNARHREQLTELLFGLVRQDPERAVEVLLDWGEAGVVDEDGLLTDVEAFADQYRGVPLRQLQVGAMLGDVLALLRRHRISLPADLSLLVKAFISLEGMGRELDPDFDMASEALPVLEKLLAERYSGTAMLERGWRSARQALALAAGLPEDLSRLLRVARRGRLEFHVDLVQLRRFGNQLDQAINRLVVGLVIAALIIGSSIVMTVSGGPTLFGLPIFGLAGFVGAVAGSLWLFASLWKSSRRDRDADD
ncbi:MAG: AarF/UbiB family protein [Pseudomonadota bacterium]|jgi:ubiquinone biosynthesis protein|nr:AarF/UbiB family protein [Pseudomonadota bacterium]